MHRHTFLLYMVLFILLSQNIFAQDNEAKKAYEEFKNQAKGEYEDFRA